MSRAIVVETLALLIGPVCAAPSAFAKGEPCRAEMDKFCKDIQPGEGRIIKCLREHDAELSDK